MTVTVQLKDWLGAEHARNKEHAELYVAIIKRAIAKLANEPEDQVAVLIGHHLTFELEADLNTENEIPSADCLMFDHDLMKAAFGELGGLRLMAMLAVSPVVDRDALLREAWESVQAGTWVG